VELGTLANGAEECHKQKFERPVSQAGLSWLGRDGAHTSTDHKLEHGLCWPHLLVTDLPQRLGSSRDPFYYCHTVQLCVLEQTSGHR
jgi:hypothetical protein